MFLHPNYLFQSVGTSSNKFKKYSVSKIVLTFHFEINCSNDLKDVENSQSLEVKQLFFLTVAVGQNNFQFSNKIPFSDPETFTRLSENQLQLLRLNRISKNESHAHLEKKTAIII